MFPVSGKLLTVNLFGCKNGRPGRDARRIRQQEFGRNETAFGREIFPAALGTLRDLLIKDGSRSEING
jgi:hypothetical protein